MASYCFIAEPIKRGSFSHLVHVIESFLNCDEKSAYKELTDQYRSMRMLMLDPSTRFKRSISHYRRDKTEDTYSKATESNIISSNESMILPTISDEIPEENSTPSESCIYSKIENPNDLSDTKDNTDILGNDEDNLQPSNDKMLTMHDLTSESSYLMLNSNHISDTLSLPQEDDSSTYKAINEIMNECNNEQKEQPYLHYLHVSSDTPIEILNKEITDEGNFASGYVSVECANAKCIQI